jgi:DNA-binding NarL/FixJ family response regulator
MRRALEAGARGYLDTECEVDDLIRAIERVHAGEVVVAPADAETALRDLVGGPTGSDGSASLTPRQLEVLRLVTQGRTNPEIAHRLCITEHTVKAHMGKLLTALQLDNRVQIAAYAVEHGLADTAQAALAG